MNQIVMLVKVGINEGVYLMDFGPNRIEGGGHIREQLSRYNVTSSSNHVGGVGVVRAMNQYLDHERIRALGGWRTITGYSDGRDFNQIVGGSSDFI